MKTVISIVGARPNFVKLAAVSQLLDQQFNHIIVHTGQHYDAKMTDIFFEELDIRKPDINLSVGSGTHAQMTGKILIRTEKVFKKIKPRLVIVYGDTNSALGGAISAAKVNIPIAHIEAGVRSYDRLMPEEVNRVIIDHISTLLLCPSKIAAKNLKKEGIMKNAHFTGDAMYDMFLKIKVDNSLIDKMKLHPKQYYFSTIHRQENTSSIERLNAIFIALNNLDCPVVMPIHPRTEKMIMKLKLKVKNLILIKPVGISDSLALQKFSKFIITDSGGVQKEAYWSKTPCLTFRATTEWPETVELGWNKLVEENFSKTQTIINSNQQPLEHPQIYGNGQSGRKIVEIIRRWISKN